MSWFCSKTYATSRDGGGEFFHLSLHKVVQNFLNIQERKKKKKKTGQAKKRNRIKGPKNTATVVDFGVCVLCVIPWVRECVCGRGGGVPKKVPPSKWIEGNPLGDGGGEVGSFKQLFSKSTKGTLQKFCRSTFVGCSHRILCCCLLSDLRLIK